MTTEMLYLEDPDCLQFETQLREQIFLEPQRYAVILARSYFYPTGGGQEADRGTLNGIAVLDVYRDQSGRVLHILPEALPLEGVVRAEIDRERRQAHQQHHTAQHLLTGCFVHLFGYETVSAGVSATTPSTIDLPLEEVTPEQIWAAEQLANRLIQQNRPVKSYFATSAELAGLPLRKSPKVSENIRIIEIEGLDVSPCGGTHVSQTGQIGALKVLRSERIHQKTRLHFVAGMLALAHFQNFQSTLQQLARTFSVHPDDLPETCARQSTQLKIAQRQLEQVRHAQLSLEARALLAEARPLNALRLVTASYPDRPAAELRELAVHLRQAPGTLAVLASSDGQKLSLLVCCHPESGLSAHALLSGLLSSCNGRGGGDAELAQGGGVGSLTEAEALLAALPAEIARLDTRGAR